MNRMLRNLLCVFCAALVLCLLSCAAWGEEDRTVKYYIDKNGRDVTEYYYANGVLAEKRYSDEDGTYIRTIMMKAAS